MKKIMISSSVIGTILTGNVIKAAQDVKISKVTNLVDRAEYTFDITNANLDSTKKTSTDILTELGVLKTTNKPQKFFGNQVTDIEKKYFISAIKENGTAGGFIEYKEGTGFQSGKQYEIYIDKIKKLDAGKLNILGGSNNEIANINSYKAYQLLKKDPITEKELLEFIKNIEDKFKVINPDTLYIDAVKINNKPIGSEGKDFKNCKLTLQAIFLNLKVEIDTQHLKDKINISIKDENLFDVNKLKDSKNFDNIKNYLKTLSTGRHAEENPDYETFLDVIRLKDEKLTPIDLEIKIDEGVYKTLSGNTAFVTGKQYTIKFPDDFYIKPIPIKPIPTNTNVKVFFKAKDGFILNDLGDNIDVQISAPATVADLINKLNTDFTDLELDINDNFNITITGLTGTVEKNTKLENNSKIHITINQENNKYIKKQDKPGQPEKKDDDKKENDTKKEEQQQPEQKQVKDKKKKCSNYK